MGNLEFSGIKKSKKIRNLVKEIAKKQSKLQDKNKNK